MKEITVLISDDQEKFLKEFASKQYPGAEDNLCTANAFHVVENKRFDYIPYSSDLTSWFEDLPLTFTTDSDYESWHDDETELIKEWYEDRGQDCPIDIKPFNEISYKRFTGINGEEELIIDFDDYFEAYGVKIVGMAWKKVRWEKAAFFFIREEAKKYLKYQAHNLTEPRIYTYSAGYANYGDFVPFRDLLFEMGVQLNKGKAEQTS